MLHVEALICELLHGAVPDATGLHVHAWNDSVKLRVGVSVCLSVAELEEVSGGNWCDLVE